MVKAVTGLHRTPIAGARPARALHRAKPAATGMKWLAGFFLLSAMQAFGVIDQLVYGNWFGKSGDKITQGLNLLLIASAVALFALGVTLRRSISTGAWMVIAFVCYLFLSATWSVDPATTVRVAMVYFFVALGCIGVSAVLTPGEFMATLRMACFLSAIASLLLLVMSPANATFADSVNFQGIFSHKNFLGQVMATGVFTCLYGLRTSRRGRGWTILMLIVFAAIAYACKSTTALMMVLAFCLIELIVALYNKGGAARILGLVCAGCCLPILIISTVDPDPFLELIGKDPTLTGRTELWALVGYDISLRPMLGWGYFAFWTVTNPAAMDIANTVQWFVPQAHNGLLELLLNVGAVGTALIFAIYVLNIALAVRCLRTAEAALGISTLIYCLGILMLGISETVLLAATESSTTVFLITGLMCEQAVRAATPTRTKARRSVPALPRFADDSSGRLRPPHGVPCA